MGRDDLFIECGAMSTNQRGVVYAVTQSDVYLEAALMSALALRSLEPNLPISIISDHPRLSRLPLHHHQITPLCIEDLSAKGIFASRWLKTHLQHFSPYRETLFLDADILPLQPVAPLWDYLAEVDWAMALDRLPTVVLCDHISPEEKRYTLERVAALSADGFPIMTPQYNSGVMLWRESVATQSLFEQWYAEWQIFQKQDQLALVRAMQHQGLPVATLPKTYNISPLDATPLMQSGKTVHLLHCWGGQVLSGEFRRLVAQYYPSVIQSLLQLEGALA